MSTLAKPCKMLMSTLCVRAAARRAPQSEALGSRRDSVLERVRVKHNFAAEPERH